jgi:hypothetical protein
MNLHAPASLPHVHAHTLIHAGASRLVFSNAAIAKWCVHVFACVCVCVRVVLGLDLGRCLVSLCFFPRQYQCVFVHSLLFSVGLRLRLPLGLLHSVRFSSRRCALSICIDALVVLVRLCLLMCIYSFYLGVQAVCSTFHRNLNVRISCPRLFWGGGPGSVLFSGLSARRLEASQGVVQKKGQELKYMQTRACLELFFLGS